MRTFAQLLNQLYFTYGNLDKQKLIEEFFIQTPDPERGYALGVMANTLEFPRFKRSLLKNIISGRIDPVLFGISNDYVGDTAETLALIWPTYIKKEELPLLTQIIEQVTNLTENELSNYLSKLLDSSSPSERWAILKLGMGDLRVGISSRFLKKVLAHYGSVNIQEIENIWHSQCPPYIELFSWLEKKGPKPSVKTLFFHPVMLSHPLDEKTLENINIKEFSIEKKFDGIRVQLTRLENEIFLFTRTGENISHSFPDIISAIKSNVVLDGELVISTPSGPGSFNDLQQRLNRKNVSKKILEKPAGLILYDILFTNNTDLRSLPFLTRREKLEEWFSINAPEHFYISPLLKLQKRQTLEELKTQILLQNDPSVEGLMLKKNNSPYISGRPKGHWYKWKRDPLTVDAVLLYAQRGHGKRSSYYSDYTFGLWENDKLLPIGKAYFGFTDEELYQLDKWIRQHTINRYGPVKEVEKALVLEVAFDAVNFSSRHKSGVALRFPRIKRIRWDKPASEADQLDTLKKLIKSSRLL